MSLTNFEELPTERGLPDYAIFPLIIYTHASVDGSFPTSHHWHEELEFIYVEEGEVEIYYNGTPTHARAGQVYFVNSKDLHQIWPISKVSCHHAIVFKSEILGSIWQANNTKFIFNINESAVRNQIATEFRQAILAYEEKYKGHKIVIRAALLKIIGLLVKGGLMVTHDEDDADPRVPIAKDIMTYIQQNYQRKITIHDLANTASMSKSYFCKFFKQMFGKTAIEYINQYRIEKACELISSSNLTLLDIAMGVGFDNFSYFIRKFKEIKKITPSQYRKGIKNQPNL